MMPNRYFHLLAIGSFAVAHVKSKKYNPTQLPSNILGKLYRRSVKSEPTSAL